MAGFGCPPRPWGGDVRKRNTHGRGGGAPNRRLAYGIWRAQKYPPDHPALADRQLEPISPQPEVFLLPPAEEEDGQGEETGAEAPPGAHPSDE